MDTKLFTVHGTAEQTIEWELTVTADDAEKAKDKALIGIRTLYKDAHNWRIDAVADVTDVPVDTQLTFFTDDDREASAS